MQVILEVERWAAEGVGIIDAPSGRCRRVLNVEFLGTVSVSIGDAFAGSVCRVDLSHGERTSV